MTSLPVRVMSGTTSTVNMSFCFATSAHVQCTVSRVQHHCRLADFPAPLNKCMHTSSSCDVASCSQEVLVSICRQTGQCQASKELPDTRGCAHQPFHHLLQNRVRRSLCQWCSYQEPSAQQDAGRCRRSEGELQQRLPEGRRVCPVLLSVDISPVIFIHGFLIPLVS